jgi:uncharacterized protein (TIGR00725 family)
MRRLLVAVIGPASCSAIEAAAAEVVGRVLAEGDAAVVCGGLGGVMEAACRGAQRAGGLTIGILPGSEASEVNDHVDVAIPTGIGEARNALVACSASAVIAIGGRYGTLSEIAFALKRGIPVIGIGTWRLAPPGGGMSGSIIHIDDPVEAARRALDLASRSSASGA